MNLCVYIHITSKRCDTHCPRERERRENNIFILEHDMFIHCYEKHNIFIYIFILLH